MHKLRKGFTLVEIIIVLAIGSLIISLVFVAASAAQRNGRDAKRKADTQKLATAIDQWAANHNGALPGVDTDNAIRSLVTDGYLDSVKFKDPSTGAVYTLFARANVSDVTGGFISQGQMYYVKDTSGNSYTIVTPLESGTYTITP